MIRFVAGLCLVAMLGSWAPHVHSGSGEADHALPFATGEDETGAISIASDDAHEDHSSKIAGDGRDCVLCRSSKERECDRQRVVSVGACQEPSSGPGIDRENLVPRPVSLGLHPTRAPPIG
jgi:hypothetical protein